MPLMRINRKCNRRLSDILVSNVRIIVIVLFLISVFVSPVYSADSKNTGIWGIPWISWLFIAVIVTWVVSAVVGGAAKGMAKQAEREGRFAELVSEYGEEVATAISNGQFWVGMPADLLEESIGEPDDLKDGFPNKTYFYGPVEGPRGGISYNLTVKLKNGFVTSWKQL
jgi:hypothetical protein